MSSNAPDSIRCGDTVAITRDGARRLGKRRFTFPNGVDLWVRICVIFRNSLTGNIVFVCFERGKVEPLGVRRKLVETYIKETTPNRSKNVSLLCGDYQSRPWQGFRNVVVHLDGIEPRLLQPLRILRQRPAFSFRSVGQRVNREAQNKSRFGTFFVRHKVIDDKASAGLESGVCFCEELLVSLGRFEPAKIAGDD